MFFTPQHPVLQNCVLSIWVIDSEAIPPHTKMLPDGYSDIMLNLGGPYRLSYNQGPYEKVEGSAFFGQRTQALRLDQPGHVNMIGIRLKPGKEFLFTGQSAHVFINRHIALTDLLGDRIGTCEEQLRKLHGQHERKVQLTEELLLPRFTSAANKESQAMDKAMEFIHQHKGSRGISDLADHLGISYKQCERWFKKHLGLTPKMYMRIIQFYHAFTRVRSKEVVDWTQLLRDYNYYDQSHFIKEYKFFTGLSPGRQFARKDTLDEFFGFT